MSGHPVDARAGDRRDRDPSPWSCVARAWDRHERELRRFLAGRVRDAGVADDLLQEVFLKALRQGEAFCALREPRAWLFEVARHAIVDRARLRKATVPASDTLPAPAAPAATPVDTLSACLAEALASLPAGDREVLLACDLAGHAQRAFAEAHGLSLAAVKARIRRARARLRLQLVDRCQVAFDTAGRVCCHGECAPTRDRP